MDRTDPVAVRGTGSILKIHVQNGDFVERGELLFETVEGTLDGLYAPGTEVVSPTSGIVSSVEKSNGDSIAKGDTLMKIVPVSSLQVVFPVQESDLFLLAEGQKVHMKLYWDTATGRGYDGEIISVSHQSETIKQSENSEKKVYYVYASITPDERIRAGMTVIASVETGGEETAEENAD